MSRIASAPITIPDAVDVQIDGRKIMVKGKNGTLQMVEELTAFVGLHSINDLKEVLYTRLSKTPKQTTKDV